MQANLSFSDSRTCQWHQIAEALFEGPWPLISIVIIDVAFNKNETPAPSRVTVTRQHHTRWCWQLCPAWSSISKKSWGRDSVWKDTDTKVEWYTPASSNQDTTHGTYPTLSRCQQSDSRSHIGTNVITANLPSVWWELWLDFWFLIHS